MSDLPDINIRPSGEEPPEPPPPAARRETRWWIAAALLVAAGAAAYFFYSRRSQPAPSAPPAAAVPNEAPEPVPSREVEAVDLPPLDETDSLVREMVRALSSHPRVAAWLATPGLIRNFTLVVENISNGQTPARHLRVLRPPGPFRILERDGTMVVDPRSYRRYDELAGAVESLDTQGSVELYRMLRPRIEEAYRELGHQEPFDEALEAAIIMLLETPIPDGEVRLQSAGALYRYDAESLEALTDAQKQLLRMGPRSVGRVQAKLRDAALALGVPAERLPEQR
jgi:hypothetical protein